MLEQATQIEQAKIEQAERLWFTPPQAARRWGVADDKVLALIHSGQLDAVNFAVDPRGKPRYRISLAAILEFEESRSTRPPLPKQRRRRHAAVSTEGPF